MLTSDQDGCGEPLQHDERIDVQRGAEGGAHEETQRGVGKRDVQTVVLNIRRQPKSVGLHSAHHVVEETPIVDWKASQIGRVEIQECAEKHREEGDQMADLVLRQSRPPVRRRLYLVYLRFHSNTLLSASMGEREFSSMAPSSSNSGLVSGNNAACCAE